MTDLANRVRAEFPALAHSDLALFDNAGGTATCRAAIEAVARYLEECPVQLGADYQMSRAAAERLAHAHQAVGTLLSDRGDVAEADIVFGSSTTDLIGKLAVALAPGWRQGDEVIVTNFDHEANIGAWRRLEERGLVIREWRLDTESMAPDPEHLTRLLSDRTRLVAFTHASNILGSALPVAALCQRVREAGALSMVDGVGYAPHRPLDVAKWHCDFYTFSLYKVFGPHTAVLYGRPDALQDVANLNHAFHAEGPPALRLTPGAFPYELAAGASGVATYLDNLGSALHGTRSTAWSAIRAHEDQLTTTVLDALRDHRQVRVVGSDEADAERLPIVSFVVPGRSSADLARGFMAHGIALRYGHFYAPRLLSALGLEPADGVVRLSLAHYNTAGEVAAFAAGLDRLLDAA